MKYTIELDYTGEDPNKTTLEVITDVAKDCNFEILEYIKVGPAGGNPCVTVQGDLLAMKKLYCWYTGCTMETINTFNDSVDCFSEWCTLHGIELKGVKGGNCNRTACQDPGAWWFNHSTQKYYCTSCAIDLNEDVYNARDAQNLYGHKLCTLECECKNTEVVAITRKGELKRCVDCLMIIRPKDKEPKIIQWQTGRQYTKNGQRIAAMVKDNVVYFTDIDRMVSGNFQHCLELDLKAQVMDHYDNNKYACGCPFEIRTKLELFIKETNDEKMPLITKRQRVLVKDPHPRSLGAFIKLHEQLFKQSGECVNWKEWLTFRDAYVEEADADGQLVCVYCGRKDLIKYSRRSPNNLATIDHVIPLSKGGALFDRKNLVISCARCNTKKRRQMMWQKLNELPEDVLTEEEHKEVFNSGMAEVIAIYIRKEQDIITDWLLVTNDGGYDAYYFVWTKRGDRRAIWSDDHLELSISRYIANQQITRDPDYQT